MAWGTDKLLSRIYMQNISYSHHHHHQPPQDLYGGGDDGNTSRRL